MFKIPEKNKIKNIICSLLLVLQGYSKVCISVGHWTIQLTRLRENTVILQTRIISHEATVLKFFLLIQSLEFLFVISGKTWPLLN